MPIFLNGGIPGSGKTLRVLSKVEKLRKESGRTVFYHRISELKLPDWVPLADPKKWYDLPQGSIIVIDEAHEVFPKRGPGAAVPEHVNRLATHRHSGYDIFLITQHAMNQLDHFVRGLIDEHEHSVRLFGAERARIHRWPQFQEKPNDYHAKKEAQTEIWSFPKEVYGWYKSAEVHTVKRKLPWKMIGALAACVLVIVYSVYSFVDRFTGGMEGEAGHLEVGQNDGSIVAKVAGAGRGSNGVITAESFSPSVEGMPFTAPFYTPAVSVAVAPRVVGCMQLKIGSVTQCTCSSQQGTRIEMEKRLCMQYVKYGAFNFQEDVQYYPRVEPYVPPLAQPVVDAGAGADASAQARGSTAQSESLSEG